MLKFYALFLAVLLFLGCTNIGFFSEDNIDKCGGKNYTSSNQICEDNILKIPCGKGNNHYDPYTQFCSNNIIYEKCGRASYSPENQICESEIIKTKCETGNNYYNAITQFCYENNVIEKCGGKNYDVLTEFCSEQDTLVYKKCEDENYNTENQRCINKTILTQCGTGNAYHNPETQFCDGNNIVNKCNKQIYNPAKQFCSEQDTSVYEKCSELKYNTETQGCDNDIIKSKCGTVLYDSLTQFCFKQDTVVYNKCGEKDYDPTKFQCENSKVLYFLFTDGRDQKEYKAMKIGNQTWMLENLKYESTLSNCIGDCEKFGISYVGLKIREICPTFWKLPSNNDWDILWKNLSDENFDFGYDDFLPLFNGNSDMWLSSTTRYDETIKYDFIYYYRLSKNEEYSVYKTEIIAIGTIGQPFHVRCIKD